jgi:hypothetical protein
MAELRTIHLSEPAPEHDGPSVVERLAKASAATLWCLQWASGFPRIRVGPWPCCW